MPPPTRITFVCAPLGVSLYLSPSLLLSSSSSSASVYSLLPVSSWRSCLCSRLMWGGGGPASSIPCFPPLSSSSASASPASNPPYPGPLGFLGLFSAGCRGLATKWASPRRCINYVSHNSSSLLLYLPPPP